MYILLFVADYKLKLGVSLVEEYGTKFRDFIFSMGKCYADTMPNMVYDKVGIRIEDNKDQVITDLQDPIKRQSYISVGDAFKSIFENAHSALDPGIRLPSGTQIQILKPNLEEILKDLFMTDNTT